MTTNIKVGDNFIPIDCYDNEFEELMNGKIQILESIQDGDYHYDGTFVSEAFSISEAIQALKNIRKQIKKRIKELKEYL